MESLTPMNIQSRPANRTPSTRLALVTPTAAPTVAPPMPALAAINAGLEQFLARMDAGEAPVHEWFTVVEARALGSLLNRGEALLHRGVAGDATECGRYAMNLGRLLQALRVIQTQLQQFAYLVTSQRQHVAAVSSWLESQRILTAGK